MYELLACSTRARTGPLTPSARLARLVLAAGCDGRVVRIRNGEGKKVRPDNLEPGEGGSGRVMVFWGDARWTRTQLLGEIARGHWGLCRASVADLTAAPSGRWGELEGRMAFAPVTEMTEDSMRDAGEEMERRRAQAVQATEAAEEDEVVHRPEEDR